jgi:hypothetical protein
MLALDPKLDGVDPQAVTAPVVGAPHVKVGFLVVSRRGQRIGCAKAGRRIPQLAEQRLP